MKRLQCRCFRGISWWPESQTNGQKGRRPKGPRLQQSRNRVIWDCVTCKVHIYDHACTRWHEQQPAVQTRSYDHNRAAAFHWVKTLRGILRLALTDYRHKPSIKLTSQQQGERSCAAALLCHPVWALKERWRERMRPAPRAWKVTVFAEKDGIALKRDWLTKICWRAGLIRFWELYYHLEDKDRK